MPAPDSTSRRFTNEATQSAGDMVELLDVMWEHARQSTVTSPASASQLRLMYLVDRSEGLRMRTLCNRLGTAPPSVTRMCDRLQAIGFLERLPCPGNGREVTLHLTSAGQAHLQRIREHRESMLRQAIDALPQTDRRALARGLAGLHAQLTEDADEHRPGAVAAA
ncbi:MarR family winged helix-turn-helix transcriptional regulator [Streptomyces sp. NPDC057302]|uniref:MarR family winged helix-turn-helix transcriptional regulator n=1 Tax=Streptomyces sp. NPDC057302 TaxID=3346094 RepID=UPI0036288CA6